MQLSLSMLSWQSMNTKQIMSTQQKSQSCSDFQSKLGTKGYESQRTTCPAWKQAPAFHTAISSLKASVVNSKIKQQRIISETTQRPFG